MIMMKWVKSKFQYVKVSIFEIAHRQCLEKCGNLIKRKVIGQIFCLLHFIWANQIDCLLVKLTNSKKF